MSFIGKLVSYFVNEIVVRTLANNKSFQRFAVKTDTFIKEKQSTATAVGEEIVNKAKSKGDEVLKTHGSKVNDAVAAKSGFNFAAFVGHLNESFKHNAKEHHKEHPKPSSKYTKGSQ